MKLDVLEYSQNIGFPNTHFYGNDAGIVFGSDYQGTIPEALAKSHVLGFAQTHGFPNATLSGDQTELAFND